MKKSRFTDEQIFSALRDAEATTVAAAVRKHGVSEQSIHRWRKSYDGMEVSDVRGLTRLCDENARLKNSNSVGDGGGCDIGAAEFTDLLFGNGFER